MALWPFKNKIAGPQKPQLQDQALRELSEMFLRNPGNPTPGADLLDANRFDYSVDSLKALDEYLETMRVRELGDSDWSVIVLRAGAYAGEVIRRQTTAPREWHWLDYKQAAARIPIVASLGISLGTAAVLWNGGDGVIFPLAKVGKYMQNGPEDSLWFYAKVMIAGPPTIAL